MTSENRELGHYLGEVVQRGSRGGILEDLGCFLEQFLMDLGGTFGGFLDGFGSESGSYVSGILLVFVMYY